MTEQNTQVGELIHVDPATLVLETNIRTVEELDKGFVDSIRENGVLVPVTGWRAEDGTITIRTGQRRTKGAQEAAIATIPVYVTDVPADEQKRLVDQIIENDQRHAITEGERVEAWKQMELAGMSATAIAKRTGTKRDQVKTGLAIAAVAPLSTALETTTLTLDQAAALIEFADDEEVMRDLTVTATNDPDYFSHAVSRARQDRERQAEAEALEAEHALKGYTILSEEPGEDSTLTRVDRLENDQSNWIRIEDIENLPGIAVQVVIGWRVNSIFYLDNATEHGFTIRPAATATSGGNSGPMTDEQKQARKELIANNKDWDAAEPVRREWLHTLIARKTLPKDAVAVIAKCLSLASYEIADMLTRGGSITRDLLGVEGHSRHQIAEYLENHPTKALHVTLATILGNIEEKTSRDAWRSPSPAYATYLQAIAAWGYTLSPVEKIAAMIPDTTE